MIVEITYSAENLFQYLMNLKKIHMLEDILTFLIQEFCNSLQPI